MDKRKKKYGDLAIIVLKSFENIEEQLNAEINKLKEIDEEVVHTVRVKQSRFQNGEGKMVIEDTVRAKDLFILCDVGNYSCTYPMFSFTNHMGPDEHFQDIKRAICAAAGRAKRVTVVMPLLYESRQHRRKGRESLDCALALKELEAMGIDGVITFDAHDANVQNAVPLLNFSNLFPTHSILKEFLENEKIDYSKGEIICVSPDPGAMDRTIYHANIFEQDVGMFYKRRDFSRVVNGKNPIVEHIYLGKDVKNKSVVVVDDMIASGGSILDVAQDLKARGAKNFFAIATYGLFTEGVEKFDKAYKDGLINRIYTTNLSFVPKEYLNKPWLKVVDLIPFLAQVIVTTNNSESLKPLIDQTQEISSIIKKIKR